MKNMLMYLFAENIAKYDFTNYKLDVLLDPIVSISAIDKLPPCVPLSLSQMGGLAHILSLNEMQKLC